MFLNSFQGIILDSWYFPPVLLEVQLQYSNNPTTGTEHRSAGLRNISIPLSLREKTVPVTSDAVGDPEQKHWYLVQRDSGKQGKHWSSCGSQCTRAYTVTRVVWVGAVIITYLIWSKATPILSYHHMVLRLEELTTICSLDQTSWCLASVFSLLHLLKHKSVCPRGVQECHFHCPRLHLCIHSCLVCREL